MRMPGSLDVWPHNSIIILIFCCHCMLPYDHEFACYMPLTDLSELYVQDHNITSLPHKMALRLINVSDYDVTVNGFHGGSNDSIMGSLNIAEDETQKDYKVLLLLHYGDLEVSSTKRRLSMLTSLIINHAFSQMYIEPL